MSIAAPVGDDASVEFRLDPSRTIASVDGLAIDDPCATEHRSVNHPPSRGPIRRMDLWTDPRRRRWIGWMAVAGGFMVFSFHRVSTTVIADELMRAFSATGTELGFLHASLFYIYAVMQMPAGVLADRIGTRRIATWGTLVMGVGVLGFALSESYILSFTSRAIMGLGGSVLYISALRYCANWYRADEFATMTGLTSAMAGVGGMLATTPLAVAVAGVGWRPTMIAIGFFGVLVAAAIYGIVRDTPADAGLPAIEGVPPSSDTSLETVATNAKRVLADPATWLLGTVFLSFIGTTFTVLGLWGVPFIVDRYGVSVQQASTYVFLGNLGFLLGPPAMGRLSDRFEIRTPIVVGASVLFAVGYASIAVVGAPPLPVVGAILFGATFVGGAGFITFALIKERHPPEASGSATGAVNSLGFVGVAILPAVMGWLLDAFWTGETVAGARVYTALGYRAAFAVAATMGVLALVGSTWYWRRRPGDRRG